MNLHEYQAKGLLREYGVAVPDSVVVSSVSEVPQALEALGGARWVVKAQVHAGGRGKAGGVQLVDTPAAVEQFVKERLGTRLVTYQTDAKGAPVNTILIEQPCAIARELYLGAVIDRATQRVIFMASCEGGVEIEEVAAKSPEKILKVIIDPAVGMQPYQARSLFFGLGLAPQCLRQFTSMLMALYDFVVDSDLSLLEINPLVVTEDQSLLCLDAKVILDENALYRHPELARLRDTTQEDEREHRAKEWDLNYISLDGNIGCMVNGAGLAMATMDLIKLEGGAPANFLDVGGGATEERVTEAFKIIVSDDHVKAILVNIFGGIVRCDLIADGIIAAVAQVGVKVPVVVRLEGNNAELGARKLQDSGLNIIAADNFAQAAQKVVQVVQQ